MIWIFHSCSYSARPLSENELSTCPSDSCSQTLTNFAFTSDSWILECSLGHVRLRMLSIYMGWAGLLSTFLSGFSHEATSNKLAGAMSGLKLYADTLSPVCRSVMSFMAVNNIQYTMENVSLAKSKCWLARPQLPESITFLFNIRRDRDQRWSSCS